MNTIELARKYGREDGLKEGMERGMERGIESVAKNLFGVGFFSDLEISKVSGLPIERVVELRREFRQ